MNFIFNNHFLLTSATDGHIAVWSLQDLADAVQCPSDSLRDCAGSIPNQWMVRRQIHQSAIKALSLARLTDSSYLCVTGGDDNGVGFSLIRKNRLDAKKDQKLLKLFQIDILLIPRAHAAAVTACAISVAGEISDECSNHNYRKLSVVTASNDQRVKLWQLSIDTEKPAVDGIQVRKGSNCFTPVADAATMDLLKDPTSGQCHAVLVCGVGVEIWRTRGDKT